jgi:hypothetical protein
VIAVFIAVAKALGLIVMVAGPIAAFGAWAGSDRRRQPAGERPARLPRAALVRRPIDR